MIYATKTHSVEIRLPILSMITAILAKKFVVVIVAAIVVEEALTL